MYRIVLIIFLLVALSSCDEGGTERASYTHALGGTPTSLDPAQASTVFNRFLVVNLFDTLYRYKYLARPYELVPNLATDMPIISPDGLTYTIHIRSDARFVDDIAFPRGMGRLVVASDFIYSILRQFDPKSSASGKWLWANDILGLKQWGAAGADYSVPVAGLSSPNDSTIVIRLIRPNPMFIHALAQGFAGIVPREAVEHWGGEFASHPVGSGPYFASSFRSTDIQLLRNPNYRKETFSFAGEGGDPVKHPDIASLDGKSLPLSDSVRLHFIKAGLPRQQALLSGVVDSLLVPSAILDTLLNISDEEISLLPEFQDKYQFTADTETGFVHLDFDMSNPEIGYNTDPGRNKVNHSLRCAIRAAYNWSARNEVFSQGTGVIFPGVIPPILTDFEDDFPDQSIIFSPELAKQLLAGDGWTAETLPTIDYGFATSVTEFKMFEQFRGFLMAIGFPADKVKAHKYASFGDYMRALNTRSFGVINSGWELDYPDASDTLLLYYGPNATPGANHANFNSAEFDAMYSKLINLPISQERHNLASKMNRLLVNECVTISGLSRTRIYVWNRRVIVLPDRGFVGGYFLRFAAVSNVYPGQ